MMQAQSGILSTMAGLGIQTQLLAGFATFAAGLTILYQYRRYQSPRSKPLQARYPELVTSDQEIQIAGRGIGIAQYGSTKQGNRVVVFFHGLPGSRILPVQNLRETCNRNSIRLIAIERPGIGLTTQAEEGKSTFEVSAQDTYAVLKSLLGENPDLRVSVIGYSLGGPHALRFVHDFPHLVDRLYLIGTAGFDTLPKNHRFDEKWQPVLHGHRLEDEVTTTPNRVAQSLARYTPSVLRTIWIMMASNMVHEDNYVDNMLQSTTAEDRASLSDATVDLWKLTGRETFRQGISGMLTAMLEVFGSSAPDGWGWDVSKVKQKLAVHEVATHFFAGKSDVFVPLSVVVGIADLVGATPENFTLYEAGHIGLLDDAMADILPKERGFIAEKPTK